MVDFDWTPSTLIRNTLNKPRLILDNVSIIKVIDSIRNLF